MNPIEECICYHSFSYSKSLMAELRRHKFCAVSYSEKADVLAICNITKNYLIDSFKKIVEDFIVSFDDVRQFIQLYSATPNPSLSKMLSFRQTCRYIFYLLPTLNLTSEKNTKSDLDNMQELCKLIAINNLLQEVNQAYGIQSLVDYNCLQIELEKYLDITYTDSFIVKLITELSSSILQIHKNFSPESYLKQLLALLDKLSQSTKRIFDYSAKFINSPADIFEITEDVDDEDLIIKGLIFNEDNVNLYQSFDQPLNPQFRTRFRPFICLKIDGKKRIFTTFWLIYEALDEISLNLLPYANFPKEWGKISEIKKLAYDVQRDLGVEFEKKVSSIIGNKYLIKSDISGFNHISLKKEIVPKTNRKVGQIDFLVIDEAKKIIYVIDAKCTKTKSFFQTFRLDKDTFDNYSTKLEDKVNWISTHKNVVAQFFKKDSFDDFKVEGVFVTNSLIFYGFFSSIPIIPLDKLLSYLEKRDMTALID